MSVYDDLLAQASTPQRSDPLGSMELLLALSQRSGTTPGRGGTGTIDGSGLSSDLTSQLPGWWTPETTTWHGVTLNSRAMASFQRASQILGSPIMVTDSFRTWDQQANAYQNKPGIAAPPGHSFHQTGLAIDVNGNAYGGYGSSQYQRLVKVLSRLGWTRFDPAGEPWHFSYKVRG